MDAIVCDVSRVLLYGYYVVGARVSCSDIFIMLLFVFEFCLCKCSRFENLCSKLLRWSLELAQYSVNIRFRPGRLNLLPDILSRPSG
jgi:hypothetical protein